MSIVEKFGHVSNEEWLELLQRSAHEPFIDGVEFPRFPHSSIQLKFNGASDAEAMAAAHALWLYAEGYSRAYGNPLCSHSKALDIGCGWGRVTRTFARDIAAENIHGVDIDPFAIALCKFLGVPGSFTVTQAGAPLPFNDNMFDVVTANSVFTHLPERIAASLLTEMNRVTKAGGVVVFTLEDELFLDAIGRPGIDSYGKRWRRLLRYADKAAELKARFADGEYIFLSTQDGSIRTAEVYGDAAIPLSWLQHNCGRLFNFVRYDAARPPLHQAVVVGRKEQ
ncbi:class I SAM-dependent methyltransferase [Methylocystis parvus]|uniref:class I SAM-dependent methyltransferase n=1 Tax=Methylocystis parvus TaxID=134 RepID=UPI003C72A293